MSGTMMSMPWARPRLGRIALSAAMLVAAWTPGYPDTASLGAPPRTIADVAAMLDQEKPDPARLAEFNAKADAQPPANAEQKALARFYFQRAGARVQLGRVGESVHDAEMAIELGRDQELGLAYLGYKQLLGQIYGWNGSLKRANEVFWSVKRAVPEGRYPGVLFSVTRWLGINTIQLGHLDEAEQILKQNQAYFTEVEKRPDWSTNPARSHIQADVAFGNAMLLQARGKYHEAAVGFGQAEEFYHASLEHLSEMPNLPLRQNIEQAEAWMAARAGRVLALEGRLSEAEISARRAIISWLKIGGKYNLNTARILTTFAMILVEEGRYAEAETLTRNVLDIYKTLDTERDSQSYAICLSQLAGILALQNRWSDAAKTYASLDEGIAGWDQEHKDEYALDVTRIFTFYNVNELQPGIDAARRFAELQTNRFGAEHPETALAQGALAVGLFRIGRAEEALTLFRTAAPTLLAAGPKVGDDDAVSAAAREERVQIVIETYMTLLAGRGPDAQDETFRLAEAIRGRSVQKALAESSVRAAAGNTELAELARTEQDLQKQIGARLGLLNNLLGGPPATRDPTALDDLRKGIAKLRATHDNVRATLTQRFPEYSDLIDPKPPSIEEVKATLRPGEAYLSFYFGRDAGFVWAIPKDGSSGFAVIPLSAAAIEKAIAKLRQALEPQVTMISDIPPFDVAGAYELYSKLLKPVEASWSNSKSLIVTTNGALGLLPLSLLPTAPTVVNNDTQPLFADYRKVNWLARTHAITLVPSAAALRTLRRLPLGSDRREAMIGFGDPLFNKEQAEEAAADGRIKVTANAGETTTRGVWLKRRAAPRTDGENSVGLKDLPRLPDTAEELKSIAIALHADPAKVLKLGKAANEQTVKSSNLSNYKIIVFATHGLVPGELDGLHEPALALTAPDVANVPGDGLLTMSKILSLKLDADWVVLSACNTGVGSGAGAETASGLGRAFFYAGTRAIVVTNWSVHSQSARQLVSDLFARQTADPSLGRSQALRQAMMALVDGKGYVDDTGKTVFTYAHPLFWAPYSIIGDSSSKG
jgi:CHAT domain-containing protein